MFYAVGIGVLVFVAILAGCQSRLIYHPRATLEISPRDAMGLDYDDVTLLCADGVKIHGWYIPAEGATQTVLVFHGNAGNISDRIETIRMLNGLGHTVFIVDYHGYGQSGGSPGETATYLDAQAAWNYLVETKQCAPSQIVLFGRSLGAAVGIELATHHPDAGGLIVESAFTSTGDMASNMYWWLPGLRHLLYIRYPSIDRIGQVKCPLLVVHSPEDEMIPFSMGQRLFEAARGPKTFCEISGPHNGGYLQSIDVYLPALDTFFRTSASQ